MDLEGPAITEWVRLGNWAQQAITLRAAALLLDKAGRHTASRAVLLGLDSLTTGTAWERNASDDEAVSMTVRRLTSRGDVAANDTRSQQLDRTTLVTYAIAELRACLI